jgi:hypothetical protein
MSIGYPDFTLPVDITRATYFALTLARMIEGGVRKLVSTCSTGAFVKVYEVPTDRKAYVISVQVYCGNPTTTKDYCYIQINVGTTPIGHLVYIEVPANSVEHRYLTGLITRLEGGESLWLSPTANGSMCVDMSIIETPPPE